MLVSSDILVPPSTTRPCITGEQINYLTSVYQTIKNKRPAGFSWVLCFKLISPINIPKIQHVKGVGWPVISSHIETTGNTELNTDGDNVARCFSFNYQEKPSRSGFRISLETEKIEVIITYPLMTKVPEFMQENVRMPSSFTAKHFGITVKEKSDSRGACDDIFICRSIGQDGNWKWKMMACSRGRSIAMVAAWQRTANAFSSLYLSLLPMQEWNQNFSRAMYTGYYR